LVLRSHLVHEAIRSFPLNGLLDLKKAIYDIQVSGRHHVEIQEKNPTYNVANNFVIITLLNQGKLSSYQDLNQILSMLVGCVQQT
jgi:hypothetical protein